MKKNSFSIYLKTNIDVLYQRLKKSKKRPLLKDLNIKEKLKELIKEREQYYKKADLVLINSKNKNYTIQELKKKFYKYE